MMKGFIGKNPGLSVFSAESNPSTVSIRFSLLYIIIFNKCICARRAPVSRGKAVDTLRNFAENAYRNRQSNHKEQ